MVAPYMSAKNVKMGNFQIEGAQRKKAATTKTVVGQEHMLRLVPKNASHVLLDGGLARQGKTRLILVEKVLAQHVKQDGGMLIGLALIQKKT